MEKHLENTSDNGAVVSGPGDNIKIILPSGDRKFPLLIVSEGDTDCLVWGEMYKDQLNELLLTYGALLLRGFEIGSAQKFNDLFSIIAGKALEYKNRTAPRDQVFNNVYTSTSHPSDQVIHMHTENSYAKTSARIIAFYCLVPSADGGETPIADERELIQFLGEEIVSKFRERNIQYVRNIFPGIGLDLKTIYQTDNKAELQRIFEESGIDYEWISDNHLRIKWVFPAFQVHPVTKKEEWFNHLYFGHKSLYDCQVLDIFDEEDLPFITYYGDGSEIEDSVIQQFKDFYDNKSIVFKWEKDDFLLLDNMRYSHGRKPYKGDRTILTAMAQPLY
jgi:alpha-ketoglutarate-dependent taurine dioxygenase